MSKKKSVYKNNLLPWLVLLPAVAVFSFREITGGHAMEYLLNSGILLALLLISLLPSFRKFCAESALTSLSIATMLGYSLANSQILGGSDAASIAIFIICVISVRLFFFLQKQTFGIGRALCLAGCFAAIVLITHILHNDGFSPDDFSVGSVLLSFLLPLIASLPSLEKHKA